MYIYIYIHTEEDLSLPQECMKLLSIYRYIHERPTDLFGHGSSRLVARLSRFRPALPTGQIIHRDGIRKRNYVSRKYSLIIPSHFEKRYRRAHISERLFIFRARGDLYVTSLYFCSTSSSSSRNISLTVARGDTIEGRNPSGGGGRREGVEEKRRGTRS